MRWTVWLALLWSPTAFCLGRGGMGFVSPARFEPPAESFSSPGQLRALELEIQQRDYAAAVGRIEGLLRQNADELSAAGEGRLAAVASLLHWMPALRDAGLVAEYRKQLDAAAREALGSLRDNPGSRCEDYYLLARRWFLSSVAAAAYVEAADRAVHLGDAPAAAACYQLARAAGWTPDEQRALMLATCQVAIGEPPTGATAAVARRAVELAARPPVYMGPLPFAAAWYGRPDSVGHAKYIPLAFDTSLYFVGIKQVLAFKGDGSLLWTWAPPQAAGRTYTADRAVDRGPGTIYAPGAFASASGGPQVLVVRQPKMTSREFSLRALRAADGKLLWATGGAAMDDTTFLSAPAVAGRYVYAVALDWARNSSTLQLLALDLMDGRALWRCALGTLSDTPRTREEDGRGWSPFWEQTEPTVSGDLVLVTPNIGLAYAVGRFDGKIRWVAGYRSAKAPGGERRGGGVREGWAVETREPRPVNVNQLCRYSNTPRVCGEVMVAAPHDTPSALGLSVERGELLWEDPDPRAGTLVGAAAGAAIFAGPFVHAIDPANGKTRWRYAPAQGAITGPPSAAGPHIHVPITAGLVVLSSADGKLADTRLRPPSLSGLLKSDAARKLLEDAQILRTMVVGENP